ncbi:hypothetical protein PSENEW3n2_00002156 [Picochlorum sp. SENEW3]|nr:hypothetical protein PSENEW3n2_00002156 [Picochlorum sp. SENEW3]WPT14926.1 hypothetical protein PSENEW3_00002156 [Picochlorum sp. SENEW3]
MRVCQSVVTERCQVLSLPSTHATRRLERRRRFGRVQCSRDDGVERMAQNSANEGLDCWTILQEFTKAEFKGTASTTYLQSKTSREVIRNAFFEAIQSRHDEIQWNPASSPVLLGILASDVRLAMRSLRDYTAALSVEFVPPDSTIPLPQIQGSVYIRYKSSMTTRARGTSPPPSHLVDGEQEQEQNQDNKKKNKNDQGERIVQCTISSYSGNDRGVLVQLGTLQIGHLPLGLLDEAMANPPAPIS